MHEYTRSLYGWRANVDYKFPIFHFIIIYLWCERTPFFCYPHHLLYMYIIYTTYIWCTFFIQFYNIHVYFHTRCQFFAHSHAACVPRIEFSCDMRTFQNFLYHHYHFVWCGAVKRNICVQKKTAATH